MKPVDIPAYRKFLPETLLEELWESSEPVPAIPGLRVAAGLRDSHPDIETDEALSFVCELYRKTREVLCEVLERRVADREFMDRGTRCLVEANDGVAFDSPDYRTVIGERDGSGRVVVGPLPASGIHAAMPVRIPDFLRGDQVTLFGPPDTAKMAINAMNALNRRAPDEPEIVARLVEDSGQVPRWGADNEDSKTPLMSGFLSACRNLKGCFDGSLRHVEEKSGKTYELDERGLAKPIKRIPGLALPDGNHLLDGNPLPLHLFDFAMHLWHNRDRPEALVFYVPKLENEEEAEYLKTLIGVAESMLCERRGSYRLGTVRVLVVFENPRAIFRIPEIAAALHPHFIGGSLGWHDFLASTARLFKNDPRYRIPVKADPDIVIKHIRESHRILARALAPIGAIGIGGMYGVLFEDGNEKSFEVSMVGYVRDVTTQLKRGLDGFWVAHPAFVRTGLALVEAWRRGPETVADLLRALIPNPEEHGPLIDFVLSPDAEGLDPGDPGYLRAVLAANVETSDVITNDDPEEVRYNVFQALQYLCDWLCGNGCVALPATMGNSRGEKVFVRVMDDLATTERSRWELWAEVAHRRVSRETFETILDEELRFIEAGVDAENKRVQVAWKDEAGRWYPVAAAILRRLVLDPDPVEFATELLLPFTFDVVRKADDPLAEAARHAPARFGQRD